MSALTAIHETEGLDRYLDEIEQRLLEAVRRHPGLAATVGEEALAAGGKRLRPLLVFLAAPPEREPPWAVGVSVELVHMATLVHDDLIDRAGYRRGHASAWARFGPEAARAAGDYLFARAFAELAATGDERAVAVLASACLSLARGEALQRAQTHDPETSVESYLERCALKTGKLFEAGCLLGSGGDRGLGEFGLSLGIAFQIADDILDCSGETIETGKIAGTDLREGTPTLPLILAAHKPLEQGRRVAVTPESATSVVLTKVLLPEADHVPLGEEADATLLIGDAALKSAFEDPTPHHDLGRLWLERTGLPMVFAVWATPDITLPGLAELEDALVASVRLARAEPERLAHESSERYGYPPGFLARYFEKPRHSIA